MEKQEEFELKEKPPGDLEVNLPETVQVVDYPQTVADLQFNYALYHKPDGSNWSKEEIEYIFKQTQLFSTRGGECAAYGYGIVKRGEFLSRYAADDSIPQEKTPDVVQSIINEKQEFEIGPEWLAKILGPEFQIVKRPSRFQDRALHPRKMWLMPGLGFRSTAGKPRKHAFFHRTSKTLSEHLSRKLSKTIKSFTAAMLYYENITLQKTFIQKILSNPSFLADFELQMRHMIQQAAFEDKNIINVMEDSLSAGFTQEQVEQPLGTIAHMKYLNMGSNLFYTTRLGTQVMAAFAALRSRMDMPYQLNEPGGTLWHKDYFPELDLAQKEFRTNLRGQYMPYYCTVLPECAAFAQLQEVVQNRLEFENTTTVPPEVLNFKALVPPVFSALPCIGCTGEFPTIFPFKNKDDPDNKAAVDLVTHMMKAFGAEENHIYSAFTSGVFSENKRNLQLQEPQFLIAAKNYVSAVQEPEFLQGVETDQNATIGSFSGYQKSLDEIFNVPDAETLDKDDILVNTEKKGTEAWEQQNFENLEELNSAKKTDGNEATALKQNINKTNTEEKQQQTMEHYLKPKPLESDDPFADLNPLNAKDAQRIEASLQPGEEKNILGPLTEETLNPMPPKRFGKQQQVSNIKLGLPAPTQTPRALIQPRSRLQATQAAAAAAGSAAAAAAGAPPRIPTDTSLKTPPLSVVGKHSVFDLREKRPKPKLTEEETQAKELFMARLKGALQEAASGTSAAIVADKIRLIPKSLVEDGGGLNWVLKNTRPLLEAVGQTDATAFLNNIVNFLIPAETDTALLGLKSLEENVDLVKELVDRVENSARAAADAIGTHGGKSKSLTQKATKILQTFYEDLFKFKEFRRAFNVKEAHELLQTQDLLKFIKTQIQPNHKSLLEALIQRGKDFGKKYWDTLDAAESRKLRAESEKRKAGMSRLIGAKEAEKQKQMEDASIVQNEAIKSHAAFQAELEAAGKETDNQKQEESNSTSLSSTGTSTLAPTEVVGPIAVAQARPEKTAPEIAAPVAVPVSKPQEVTDLDTSTETETDIEPQTQQLEKATKEPIQAAARIAPVSLPPAVPRQTQTDVTRIAPEPSKSAGSQILEQARKEDENRQSMPAKEDGAIGDKAAFKPVLKGDAKPSSEDDGRGPTPGQPVTAMEQEENPLFPHATTHGAVENQLSNTEDDVTIDTSIEPEKPDEYQMLLNRIHSMSGPQLGHAVMQARERVYEQLRRGEFQLEAGNRVINTQGSAIIFFIANLVGRGWEEKIGAERLDQFLDALREKDNDTDAGDLNGFKDTFDQTLREAFSTVFQMDIDVEELQDIANRDSVRREKDKRKSVDNKQPQSEIAKRVNEDGEDMGNASSALPGPEREAQWAAMMAARRAEMGDDDQEDAEPDESNAPSDNTGSGSSGAGSSGGGSSSSDGSSSGDGGGGGAKAGAAGGPISVTPWSANLLRVVAMEYPQAPELEELEQINKEHVLEIFKLSRNERVNYDHNNLLMQGLKREADLRFDNWAKRQKLF